jgi:hypothetical protein
MIRYIMDINSIQTTGDNMETEHSIDETTAGFTIPFTKEDLKKDVLDVMLILLNQTRFTFFRTNDSEAQLWALLSKKPLENAGVFAMPDKTAADLGLSFQDIESIEMVQTLIELYDYGVHGILDTSISEWDDCDGGANWLSRILFDLHRSKFLEDWMGYILDDPREAMDRCLFVAELANARLMLEGGREGFFLGSQDSGVLNIRQMSLLSGMTEASVRTLAGPNRKNRLVTKKEGTNTVVAIEDAKAWLVAKGRYVPVRRVSARGAEDLTNRRFVSISDFEGAIFDRRQYLNTQHDSDVVGKRIAESGVLALQNQGVSALMRQDFLGETQLLNADLMRRLADALELPPDVFALRAAEAATVDKLRSIEELLKQVQKAK